MATNTVCMVIGSWGSYNECNERALGSRWLTLNDYAAWVDIEAELEKMGFILNGIDEELFIQDIENFPTEGMNCDFTHPKELFDLLRLSGVLDDASKFAVMEAFLETEGYREWARRVRDYEESWDNDIYLYPGFDWSDLARHMIYEVNCYDVPDWLCGYIDYENFGRQ